MSGSVRILIFGGSFNPPTLAHEAIIRTCLELPEFDAVWVMPSGSRLDKQISTSDEHRLRLLQAMKHGTFADDLRLYVSDFELKLPRPTEMYRTVQALVERYPNNEFWFVYGGDAYRSMSTWPGASEFMPGLHVVVFTEHDVSEIGNGRIIRLHLPPVYNDTSSTAAREALAAGQDVSDMLSGSVLEYSQRQNLYLP